MHLAAQDVDDAAMAARGLAEVLDGATLALMAKAKRRAGAVATKQSMSSVMV